MTSLDKKIIDNIKMLGINMISEAGSGHPGIVLSAAPIIYTLYAKHLKFNPTDDKWINRDRFVMSAGHGSALLYATLFMAGFDIELDDLKRFRQINSITPGHPELNITKGVDYSTGPLGQGISSAIGMAIAEKYLKSNYNIDKKYEIFNHNIYVLCGDGDLMEGVSYEATSLAGTLRLDNLIVLYDSNDTSLDGKTNITFNDNIQKRFESINWNYILVKNGNDIDSIDRAISMAKKSDKPTLIEVKTILGNGSLLEGTNKVHGSPLSSDDIEQLTKKLDIRNIPFTPSNDAVEAMRSEIKKRNGLEYDKWNDMLKEYLENASSDVKKDFNILKGLSNIDTSILPKNFDNIDESLRVSNSKILNILCSNTKLVIGGSADLSSSTKTYINDKGIFSSKDYSAPNIMFGVREHAMASIINGIATYNIRVFASTFLTFSDYLKPAIRMSALMNLPVIYMFTHDSIDVGEDGPTHEPIEQLTMLRSIPNLDVYTPCDIKEIVGCYNLIFKSKHPSVIVLSRNEVKLKKDTNPKKIELGAYTIKKEKKNLSCVLISSGSTIDTVLAVSQNLENEGIGVRVVSMPAHYLIEKQDTKYLIETFPKQVKKIFIEPNNSFKLIDKIHRNIHSIYLDEFGVSGKRNDVLSHFNFDENGLEQRIKNILNNNN